MYVTDHDAVAKHGFTKVTLPPSGIPSAARVICGTIATEETITNANVRSKK